MWTQITTLLFDPVQFFRENTHNLRMEIPGSIVFTAGLFVFVSLLILGERIVQMIPRDGVFLFVILHGFSSFGSLIGIVVLWPVLSLAVDAVAGLLIGAKPSLRAVMVTLGWSYAPLLLFGFLLIAIAHLWPLPETMAASVSELKSRLVDSRLLHVSNQLRMLFVGWSAFLAVSGLRIVYGTSLFKASISLLLPVGALCAVQWWIMSWGG